MSQTTQLLPREFASRAIARVLIVDSKDSDPVFEEGQNKPFAYVVELTVSISWME